MDGRRLLAVAPVAHPGGAEIGLLRLLARLRARGWDTRVATPAPGPLRDAAVAAGHATTTLPLGDLRRGGGRRALSSWPRAHALAGESDVVYLNGSVCGRLLPAVSGAAARSVLHVHDIVARVPRLWRRADIVLTDSAAAAAPLRELDPHVVFCPVEADPPVVAAPWQPGEGPIVAFVGRLERRKGAIDLVHAAAAIRAGSPAARVVLVGDDPYRSDPGYTTAVRAAAAASGVEQYGWIDDAAGLMRHVDVLVAPSHQEPFGTVLAEAMAVGTPVVATRVGGLAEVVDDGVTGVLVAPGEPDALAAAVLEVLARRDELGANAREHARRFGADAYADRIERLIAPVAERAAAR